MSGAILTPGGQNPHVSKTNRKKEACLFCPFNIHENFRHYLRHLITPLANHLRRSICVAVLHNLRLVLQLQNYSASHASRGSFVQVDTCCAI